MCGLAHVPLFTSNAREGKVKRGLRAVVMASLAGALGLGLAVVPTNFAPDQAHAAIAPGIPDPVNVLPSVLKGSVGNLPGARFTYALSNLMNTYAKNPAQWAAITASKAGVATTTEAQLVGKIVSGFRLPTTAVAGLMKVAGPVGIAVTGLDLGFMSGNGLLDVMGISRTAETLCTPDASNPLGDAWVSIVNKADCAGYQQATAEMLAQANADITPGLGGQKVCGTGVNAGKCIQLIAVYPRPAFPTSTLWEFSVEGGLTALLYWTQTPPAGQISANWRGTNWGCETDTCVMVAATTPLLAYAVEQASPKSDVTQNETDPDRFLRCQVTVSNGQTYTAESAVFKESSGTVPAAVCPQFPPEFHVTNVTIWEIGGGEQHELLNQDTTPEYDAAATNYPECMDGTCRLDLQKTGVSCFQSPGPCADWYSDPNKTDTMTCRYGSHAVALSECNVYAPTFQPDAKPTGKTYGDPATGEPLPNPNPGASMPGSVEDPSEPRNCYPTGWGILNPVEWVLKPVQCALEWAFVPRAEKVDELSNKASNAWKATTLAKATTSLESIAPVLIGLSDGGCAGMLIDLSGVAPDILHLGSYRFLPACAGDFFYPWAIGVKSLLVIGIAFTGFLSVKAQVSRFVSNGEA